MFPLLSVARGGPARTTALFSRACSVPSTVELRLCDAEVFLRISFALPRFSGSMLSGQLLLDFELTLGEREWSRYTRAARAE